MDSKTVLIMTFGLLFLAVTSGQLVTPFQVCQMKCQDEMKAYHDLDSNIDVGDVCKEYCLKHAYDHLGGVPTDATNTPPIVG